MEISTEISQSFERTSLSNKEHEVIVQLKNPTSHGATSTKTVKAPDSVSNRFSDFYRNTTIHGVKYLRGRHHRPFWVVVMIVSFMFCINSIRELWLDWEQNNISSTQIENYLTKSDVQFPAVTICSEALVNTDVLNLSQIDPQNAEE